MTEMEMEMEMVMMESVCIAERRKVSVAETCEITIAMGKPSSSSPSFSLLESILDMALARFMPCHMEVQMGEAFMATVDAKELEMMMVMLKPLDARPKSKSTRCRGDLMSLDMETEMVHMEF